MSVFYEEGNYIVTYSELGGGYTAYVFDHTKPFDRRHLALCPTADIAIKVCEEHSKGFPSLRACYSFDSAGARNE